MNYFILPAGEIHSVSASLHYAFYSIGDTKIISAFMIDLLLDQLKGRRNVGEVGDDTLILYYQDAGMIPPQPNVAANMMHAIATFLDGYIDRQVNFTVGPKDRVTARVTAGNLFVEISPYSPVEKLSIEELKELIRTDIIRYRDSRMGSAARRRLRSLVNVGNNIYTDLYTLDSLTIESKDTVKEIHERTGELYAVWKRAKEQWFPKKI